MTLNLAFCWRHLRSLTPTAKFVFQSQVAKTKIRCNNRKLQQDAKNRFQLFFRKVVSDSIVNKTWFRRKIKSFGANSDVPGNLVDCLFFSQ